MSSPILEKLRGERDQVRTAAVAIAEGENFNPEDENFVELETRAKTLDTRIEKLANLLNDQATSDAFYGRMAKAAKQREEQAQQTRQAPNTPNTRESWGTRFIKSDVFTEYRGRGQSPRFEIADADLQTRALPTGIGSLIDADFGNQLGFTTVDIQPPIPPTPLLTAMSNVTVSNNAIEFVKWELVDGGPAVVPEGQAKPSMEYGPVVTADTLQMIAGYTQLTRQLIEDAPAVRNYIDQDMRRQVLFKEEEEATDVLSAASLDTATGSSMLAAIRHGIAIVQTSGYTPNVVLLNPGDWADLDLDVMAATVNGPNQTARFWGLTPVPVPAQPEGEAIVGDFATAVTHFTRSGVNLYITDSHGETFLSNVFTLLAERRARTAVIRPDALIRCTANGASGSSAAAKKTAAAPASATGSSGK